MTTFQNQDVPVVTTRGAVSEREKTYAMAKIGSLVRFVTNADEPVLFVEIKLTQEPDPARDRPSIAEAVLDVNGQAVRGQLAAHDMTAAIDLLVDDLRRRLERHAHIRDDRRARRRLHHEPEAHEWVHGQIPTHRPEQFDRPVDERQIVRRKTFAPTAMTPDEAVDALDLLEHQFFLFTNLNTGADAVVSVDRDHRLELVDASGRDDAVGPDTVAPLNPGRLDPPRCSVAEATEQLDLDLLPFVFFIDAETGRGNVLYRRYDGHYGLVTNT